MANRYNTGNLRPSGSMKVLNDNALTYGDFINSDEDVAYDRFGKPFPIVLRQVAARVNEIIGAQIDAEQYAESARKSGERAESIADANTFPDTVSGIAGTTEVQYFSVPQNSSFYSFGYYRNASSSAIAMAYIADGKFVVPLYQDFYSSASYQSVKKYQEAPEIFDGR